MKFNIFKKKLPASSAGEKEALLKMKAPEEWPPPPVDQEAGVKSDEEISTIDLLIQATKEKRVIWKRMQPTAEYTKLGYYLTFDDRSDYFVIEEEVGNLAPVKHNLTFFSGDIMTLFYSGEYNPKHTELWNIIYEIGLEKHEKALEKVRDYLKGKQ